MVVLPVHAWGFRDSILFSMASLSFFPQLAKFKVALPGPRPADAKALERKGGNMLNVSSDYSWGSLSGPP